MSDITCQFHDEEMKREKKLSERLKEREEIGTAFRQKTALKLLCSCWRVCITDEIWPTKSNTTHRCIIEVSLQASKRRKEELNEYG